MSKRYRYNYDYYYCNYYSYYYSYYYHQNIINYYCHIINAKDVGTYSIKMGGKVQLRQVCTVHSRQSLPHHANYIHIHKYICIYKNAYMSHYIAEEKKHVNPCCTLVIIVNYYYCYNYHPLLYRHIIISLLHYH